MTILQKQIGDARDGGVRTVGEMLLEIGRLYPHAAEIIEQDLANPDMSIEKCYKELYAYAAKHQKNRVWQCGGISISPDNEAVRVLLDFYKITLDEPAAADTQAFGHDYGNNVIDLLDLL